MPVARTRRRDRRTIESVRGTSSPAPPDAVAPGGPLPRSAPAARSLRSLALDKETSSPGPPHAPKTRRHTIAPPLPNARRLFRRRLLDWYRRNGRDLPWRHTRDPYHILVSEVMLQQTQVDRVLPKYEEWLGRFPTLEALATADEADVAETWRPLGYNIRPRRLHAIAKESMAKYGGELPGDQETLLSFKGIGEYTAGAVLSFAFGQRAAILDTNVARVLFRVFVGRGNPKAHAMRGQLWTLSRTLLPVRHVFDFNQALMDFGATLCTARKPQCLLCPMRQGCAAYPFNPDNERA